MIEMLQIETRDTGNSLCVRVFLGTSVQGSVRRDREREREREGLAWRKDSGNRSLVT